MERKKLRKKLQRHGSSSSTHTSRNQLGLPHIIGLPTLEPRIRSAPTSAEVAAAAAAAPLASTAYAAALAAADAAAADAAAAAAAASAAAARGVVARVSYGGGLQQAPRREQREQREQRAQRAQRVLLVQRPRPAPAPWPAAVPQPAAARAAPPPPPVAAAAPPQQHEYLKLMLLQFQLQQPRQGGCWQTAPQQGVQLGMPLQGVIPLASASAAGRLILPPPQGHHGQVPQQQGDMQPSMQLHALQDAERRQQAELAQEALQGAQAQLWAQLQAQQQAQQQRAVHITELQVTLTL
jgi:hypothetical protein